MLETLRKFGILQNSDNSFRCVCGGTVSIDWEWKTGKCSYCHKIQHLVLFLLDAVQPLKMSELLPMCSSEELGIPNSFRKVATYCNKGQPRVIVADENLYISRNGSLIEVKSDIKSTDIQLYRQEEFELAEHIYYVDLPENEVDDLNRKCDSPVIFTTNLTAREHGVAHTDWKAITGGTLLSVSVADIPRLCELQEALHSQQMTTTLQVSDQPINISDLVDWLDKGKRYTLQEARDNFTPEKFPRYKKKTVAETPVLIKNGVHPYTNTIFSLLGSAGNTLYFRRNKDHKILKYDVPLTPRNLMQISGDRVAWSNILDGHWYDLNTLEEYSYNCLNYANQNMSDLEGKAIKGYGYHKDNPPLFNAGNKILSLSGTEIDIKTEIQGLNNLYDSAPITIPTHKSPLYKSSYYLEELSNIKVAGELDRVILEGSIVAFFYAGLLPTTAPAVRIQARTDPLLTDITNVLLRPLFGKIQGVICDDKTTTSKIHKRLEKQACAVLYNENTHPKKKRMANNLAPYTPHYWLSTTAGEDDFYEFVNLKAVDTEYAYHNLLERLPITLLYRGLRYTELMHQAEIYLQEWADADKCSQLASLIAGRYLLHNLYVNYSDKDKCDFKEYCTEVATMRFSEKYIRVKFSDSMNLAAFLLTKLLTAEHSAYSIYKLLQQPKSSISADKRKFLIQKMRGCGYSINDDNSIQIELKHPFINKIIKYSIYNDYNIRFLLEQIPEVNFTYNKIIIPHNIINDSCTTTPI